MFKRYEHSNTNTEYIQRERERETGLRLGIIKEKRLSGREIKREISGKQREEKKE